MAIREGRWDCPQCSTKGILGRHKICPSCGHPRPEGVRFYLPEEASEVTDPQLLSEARAGADWLCEHCGASNRATAELCQQCGAPKGSSPAQQERTYASHEVPRSGEPPQPAPAEAKLSVRASFSPPSGLKLGLPFLLFLLCAVAIAATLFRPQEQIGTVTELTWQRTIAVEALRNVVEEEWSVPSGGRLVEEYQALHHVDRVVERYEDRQREVSEQVQVGTRSYVCGQRDLGNGFFEDVECTEPVYENRTRIEHYQEPIYREVPIYRTKYRYEIDRWIQTREEQASGSGKEPRWPSLTLGQKEREGKRSERYTVHLADEEGKRYEMGVPLEEWLSFAPGERYKIKRSFGGKLEIVGPAP